MEFGVSQCCLLAGFDVRPALELASGTTAEGAEEFVGRVENAGEVVVEEGGYAVG